MRQFLLAAGVCATVGIAAFGQQNPPAQPTSADPYLNNAAAGTTTFPLSDANMWGGVPGGYRNTINDNIVLILMIETLERLANADDIAKVPGVTAIFAASNELGTFSGFRQGRLRARCQHRPRQRDQGGHPIVRAARLARPA
jgi:hypothetical protein